MVKINLEVVNYHNSELYIKNFIRFEPNRLQLAMRGNLGPEAEHCCNLLDCVEYFYRRYVSGQDRTMHRVLSELRNYMSDGQPPGMVTFMISKLRELILDAEFYELMPRLESSAAKINTLISSLPRKN